MSRPACGKLFCIKQNRQVADKKHCYGLSLKSAVLPLNLIFKKGARILLTTMFPTNNPAVLFDASFSGSPLKQLSLSNHSARANLLNLLVPNVVLQIIFLHAPFLKSPLVKLKQAIFRSPVHIFGVESAGISPAPFPRQTPYNLTQTF